jgi:hypothetical protein
MVDADRCGVPAFPVKEATAGHIWWSSFVVSTRVAIPVSLPEASFIAGSVLPIQRAEELLSTLPGVISARIVASGNGSVEEIHILTTDEVSPKQTVRNVESALIAHLGMRVSHKKISVATSSDASRGAAQQHTAPKQQPEGMIPIRGANERAAESRAPNGQQPQMQQPAPSPTTAQPQPTMRATPPQSMPHVTTPSSGQAAIPSDGSQRPTVRRLYFEDIEVRRSRSKGVACRVTLRKGEQAFVGEAEGLENERLRIELAARATLSAISQAEGDARVLGLEGCKAIEAFDRSFVFVGLTTRTGRESALLTGSAEVKESQETASVLAVLDATNRWIDYSR